MTRHALPDRRRPCAGVSLKPDHIQAIFASPPDIGFFEVHAENYMGAGGAPHRLLETIRRNYPISIHGVGLSLAGAEPLDAVHLDRLAALVQRYEPLLVSEHLAWSMHAGAFLNDLLPIPYTTAALEHVAERIDRTQTRLGRNILLENPSTYLAFEDSTWSETDFIAELAARTGCGLLLDVSNVVVSATNQGRDAAAWLAAFPMHRVEEIHLAGYSVRADAHGLPLLIDSHDQAVSEAVWALYRQAIARTGPVPTLIERDSNIPALDDLVAEAARAHDIMHMHADGGVLAIAC